MCPDVTIEGSVTHSWVDQGVGDVVEVECNRKHVLNGEAKLTCETNATWSVDPPTCKKLGKYVQDN